MKSRSTLTILGGSPVRTRPFPPWPIFDEKEENALKEVLESRVWGIDGTKVPEFEQKFSTYTGTKYAIAAFNGSVTLEVALRAAGIGPGDEVIIPSYTFYATMSSVLYVGAVPVFVDIHPETYCIDPDKIEESITARTRAIIAVHLGGNPCEMNSILRIASRHNLFVLEDAAQAHGSRLNGKMVGSFGNAGSFSFQSSKNLSCGEGGIITTNDESLNSLCRSLINCGRVEGRPWYEHHYLGDNYRMTEFQAAVLLSQLERAEPQLEKRAANAQFLKDSLSQIPGIEPLKSTPGTSRRAYHLFIIKYNKNYFNNISRDKFLKALNAEGIPAERGYIPAHKLPLFYNKNLDVDRIFKGHPDPRRISLPVTEKACSEEAIWLPQNILLAEPGDMKDIISAFEKIYTGKDQLLDIEEEYDEKHYYRF